MSGVFPEDGLAADTTGVLAAGTIICVCSKGSRRRLLTLFTWQNSWPCWLLPLGLGLLAWAARPVGFGLTGRVGDRFWD